MSPATNYDIISYLKASNMLKHIAKNISYAQNICPKSVWEGEVGNNT